MADPILSLAQVIAQFSQQVAQMNAHLRGASDEATGRIHGFYNEAKRLLRSFDENRGLRYRPAAITLDAAVGASGAGNNDFRVSNTEDFLVKSIRGFVIINDLAAQDGVAALAGQLVGMTTMRDTLLAKAQNCRVTLQNKDSKVPVTENTSLSLASICPEVGGTPMVFGPDDVPGFVIPHNTTLQALFALQSTAVQYVTASTNYGIILSGLYMSREVR